MTKPKPSQSFIARLVLILLLTTALPCPIVALDAVTTSAVQSLVFFSSDEGLARLSRSTAKLDFAALANQFEAQSNAVFCGPTSAAIVLNALFDKNTRLPRDRSRFSTEDLRYLPDKFDLTVPRFTQEGVISKGNKTRAQVLGEPITFAGKPVNDFGYQLRQLDEMLRANGVITQLSVVDNNKGEQEVRADLVNNLKRRGDYVIVAYKRGEVGQHGGGHISPLAAYDAVSDSFLVLDVNPANANWVWMPAAILIKGMRTFDTLENRGYILIQSP